jgi:hypothetical protein
MCSVPKDKMWFILIGAMHFSVDGMDEYRKVIITFLKPEEKIIQEIKTDSWESLGPQVFPVTHHDIVIGKELDVWVTS